MTGLEGHLSLSLLFRRFWYQVSLTWILTLVETVLLASLPLLIGWSIDGLMTDDWAAFFAFLTVMGALLLIAVVRRMYDTRVYGTMRVELGCSVVTKAQDAAVSKKTARLDMSRELVDFLENEAPLVLTAVVHVTVSIMVLASFHGILAATSMVAAVLGLGVYGLFGLSFFQINRDLNQQIEKQVQVLEGGVLAAIRLHLLSLRRHEVRLSDMEALVYGLIFAVLMAMLGFNLWLATVQIGASAGTIFTIVTYSFEFMESAVTLPIVLQSLTRILEITARINEENP